MKLKKNNYAFIDGANLHNGVKNLSWKFDYRRFRVWLLEKYNVTKAYIFIGMMPQYKDLYASLKEQGYILVFKEVIYENNGKPKGNCDADLVLQTAQDVYEGKFDKGILVSSDGDYASLVKFLIQKQKIESVLSPYETKKCSVLLKRTGVKIAYLNDQKTILEHRKEKAPGEDKTSQGSLS